MKLKLYKFLLVFLFSLCLLGLLIFPNRHTVTQPIQFSIGSGADVKNIYPFINKTGEYYVFLPSYVKMDQITLRTNDNRVRINGIEIADYFPCGEFAYETEYSICVNNTESKLIFLKSSNIASLFVDTASNDVYRLNNEKNYKEYAKISLLTAEGKTDFISSNCFINSRGNTTWGMNKKPYQLTLPDSESLLNMGDSLKWILLSNSLDLTNLKNKLVYDFAKRIGMEDSPDCQYVDLYLNGEYNGLYLLCSKIEAGTDKLGLNTQENDFLCKIDLNERIHILNNPFTTSLNRTVEVSAPTVLSYEQKNKIKVAVDTMEQMIMSGSFSTNNYKIDIESWINRYLIDEIFANIDSDMASSYFYCKDGTFFAGPVWDYDLSLLLSSRSVNPKSFVANSYYKYADNYSLYYHHLYKNELFYSSMTQTYKNVFLPLLEDLVKSEITRLSDFIADAAYMDAVRWDQIFNENSDHNEKLQTAETIIAYLNDRIDFLNSVWIDGEEYCTVLMYNTETSHTNYTVKKGEVLDGLTEEMRKSQWKNASTNELFDLEQPIVQDIILYNSNQNIDQLEPENSTRDYIAFATIAILLIIMLFLAVSDVRRRLKERKSNNAKREQRK